MLSTGVIRLVGKEKERNTGRARPPSYVGLKLVLFFLMIWQWRQRQSEPRFYIGPEDTFGDEISEPKRIKKHSSQYCAIIALATAALPQRCLYRNSGKGPCSEWRSLFYAGRYRR